MSTLDRRQSAPATAGPDRPRRPHVVIVGAGFGGLAAALGLAGAPVDVTVVDRRNYHLFQPLLYQVATAGLAPSQIATPIRSILGRHANIRVLMDRVTGIDADARRVLLGDRAIAYDRLVVATGARHAYFGHDDWEQFAPGLKKIDDATFIRRRILEAFERAENEPDAAARRTLLTFVVVGAGPTGVEMAGAIAELANRALRRDFRHIDPASARIVLIEAGPRVLPSFPETLSARAAHALARAGVDVRTHTPVTQCDGRGVVLGETRLDCATLIWAAGVMASPAAKWLDAAMDRAGRAVVDDRLRLPGRPEIHVIGDTAQAAGQDGKALPGVAPVAKQQGQYVARTIRAELSGRKQPGPFRYRNMGSMATIGRKAAICDFGRVTVSGLPAWLLWCLVHVWFLIGFRNRIGVMTDWAWSYLTFQRGARLITGPGSEL